MKSIVLSLIAAVAIAAPASNFFQNKGTATAPNMSYKPQYFQAMTPSSHLSDVELGRYVDELNECYDVNGDQLFNRAEMIDMLKGTLYGQPCPAKRNPQGNSTYDYSDLLGEDNLRQLESFFGNKSFSLTRLYAANNSKCDALTWHKAVDTKAQILTIANTTFGKFIGGYSSVAWKSVPTYSTLTYIDDPKAFVFSFTHNKQISAATGYTNKAISVRPAQSYVLNDWGYETLHLRQSIDGGYQGKCQAYVNVNYTPAYKFTGLLTQSEFIGTTANWVYLNSLETFQVTFN